MLKKIALVGTAPSSVHAPFDDPSWQIWGVGFRGDHVTRADRWFEIHRLAGEDPEWAKSWRESICKWGADCELMMFYPEEDLGNVTTYPIERISKRFGTYFMTSTFSWMMALAIDQLRPKDGDPIDGEIGLWGVDMEYNTEYKNQRSGLRHFMDVARVLDIPITRLASSGIAFEPTPYPLIQDDPLIQKLDLRQRETAAMLADRRDVLRRTETMIAVDSALGKDTASLELMASNLAGEITHLEGVAAEQNWFDDYLRP